MSLGFSAMASPPMPGAAPPARPATVGDVHWQDCRNNLGIARLLVQEGRPDALVATACRMAVERACRAALDQAGLPFDGDVEGALLRLGCLEETGVASEAGAAARLASAEAVVSRVAARMRGVAPDRSWGF